MKRDARDGVLINLEDVIVAQTFFNHRPGALDQFI